MKYDFADLVDTDQLRSLLEGFTNVVGTATAILDVHGEVIVAAGWQDICTRFHRVHPKTCARCVESDTELAGQVMAGEKYTRYQCRNGLVDVATPVFVEGIHVGNVFTGQFFLEPPDVEFFRKQAAEFGFDETAYLDALSKVPIRTRDQIVGVMDFLSSLAELVGTMGLAKKRLLAANAELAIRNRVAQVFLTIANDDTYPEVLRVLLEAVQSKQGVFGYLDEDGTLVCPAVIGETFTRCPFVDGGHSLPRESWEDVLCCRALVEKRAFCSNEPTWLTPDGQVSVDRYVCLPVVYRQKAIGLLFVADKANDYDEEDVRLLETIAAHIAPVLHARLEGDRQARNREIAERERSRLIAILEATSDLVSTATPEGRLTYMNRAGRAMLGWSGDEDVRLRCISELHHRPAAESALHEAIPAAERDGIWIGETLLLRRDGAEVPVSQVVMAHRSEDGRLEYFSTIMRDISEQRRAELEREELIARLESQNAE